MSVGAGRLNEQGNPVTPVAARVEPPAPVPGDSIELAIKVESSPVPIPSRHTRASSVTMADAPPLPPMGVTTTASRSQLLRRPQFDYRDPAARARYEALLEAEIAAVRSGASLPGSPSTASNPSSPESSSMAIRGPSRRTPRDSQMATIEERLSPTRVGRGAVRGGGQSGRGQFRGVHTRFLSSDEGESEASRGRGR